MRSKPWIDSPIDVLLKKYCFALFVQSSNLMLYIDCEPAVSDDYQTISHLRLLLETRLKESLEIRTIERP